LNEKASEGLFAFLYLENSDQQKYGTILNNLSSQKSLKNDQYPKTIVETNNVLSNHKLDIRQQKQKGKDGKEKHPNKINKEKEKDNEESTPLLFAQMEGKCYCCGKKGHRSPEFYSKSKIPQAEWAINKSQQHAQQKKKNAEEKVASASTASEAKTNEEALVGWTGLHYSFAQAAMKCFYSVGQRFNRLYSLQPNIQDLGTPLSINTNGGVMNSTHKCDIMHMEDVWHNESSVTNIANCNEGHNQEVLNHYGFETRAGTFSTFAR
jgi:hypothetical protein